jgi:hypothetical protein
MISYLYTYDYRDEEHPRPSRDQHQDISGRAMEDQPALLSSVRVYAIADKYDIPPLKEIAKKRFGTSAEKNWTHRDFSGIVKEIFESTPTSDRGLRGVAIRIVASHADVLVQKDEFRELIEEVGDLGLNTICLLLEKEKADLRDRLNRTSEKDHSTLKMINEWCKRCGKKLVNAKVCKGCQRIWFT